MIKKKKKAESHISCAEFGRIQVYAEKKTSERKNFKEYW